MDRIKIYDTISSDQEQHTLGAIPLVGVNKLAHKKKAQSTGSYDKNMERHQKPVGRGKGQGPKATRDAYRPAKFKTGK